MSIWIIHNVTDIRWHSYALAMYYTWTKKKWSFITCKGRDQENKDRWLWILRPDIWNEMITSNLWNCPTYLLYFVVSTKIYILRLPMVTFGSQGYGSVIEIKVYRWSEDDELKRVITVYWGQTYLTIYMSMEFFELL